MLPALQAEIYDAEIHETTSALRRVLVGFDADVEFTSISGGHDLSWWNPWRIRTLTTLESGKVKGT